MTRPVLLVVDDDEDMRLITRKTLERTAEAARFELREAASVREACTVAASCRDAGAAVHVIADHGLPDGTGIDLFTALAGNDVHLQDRFLLITSSLWTVDASAATAAGVEHVVEKPFGVRPWTDLIGGWVARWHRQLDDDTALADTDTSVASRSRPGA